MTKSISKSLSAGICLTVLVSSALADEPLKVGDTAVDHLGTGMDDKPLVLSKYRGKFVCFACVDHHK